MSYSAHRCHTISYGGNGLNGAKNNPQSLPLGYGKDVWEAILSVPERRDYAQTVISDKSERVGVMLKCHRFESSCNGQLGFGRVAFFPAQPHHVSKNIHTRLPTERAGSLCEITNSCGVAKLPSVGSSNVISYHKATLSFHLLSRPSLIRSLIEKESWCKEV